MKITIKSLCMTALSMLCFFATADAADIACPEGCFCLDNGVYSNITYHTDVSARCGKGATLLPKDSKNSVSKLLTGVDGYLDAEYVVTKMINDEEQYINYYGVKNGTFYGDRISGNMFVCPITYPHSAKGSKKLTDCFQYGANGAKIYYGNKYVANTYSNNNYVTTNSGNYDVNGIKTLVLELQDVSNKINRIASELQQVLKANNMVVPAAIVSEPTDYGTTTNNIDNAKTQTYETTTNGPFRSSILNSYAGH